LLSRDIASRLKARGFQFDRQAAGIPEGTLRAILRQAGIDPDIFLAA